MKILGLTAAALVALGLVGTDARATPIAPVGTTDVTVDAGVLDILTGAGIAPSAISPATVSGATFSFPITGGDTNPLVITHSGGVRLDDGTNFVEVSDFVIDGSGPNITGTVFGSADAFMTPVSGVDLFSLTITSAGPPVTADVFITPTLSGALGLTFFSELPPEERPDLGGALFGTASTAPQPVPLPAAAPLLLAGLGAFAFLRRKRAS